MPTQSSLNQMKNQLLQAQSTLTRMQQAQQSSAPRTSAPSTPLYQMKNQLLQAQDTLTRMQQAQGASAPQASAPSTPLNQMKNQLLQAQGTLTGMQQAQGGGTSTTSVTGEAKMPTAGISTPSAQGTPFFHGDDALIQIEGQSGITYLVDPETKQIHPFASMQALQNFYQTMPGSHQIRTVPSSAVTKGAGGMFSDYDFLPSSQYAIDEQGNIPQQSASSSQLQAAYGKTVDDTTTQNSFMILDGFLSSLKNNPSGGSLSAQTIQSVVGNTRQMALYISAMAYGGYTTADVYKDMMRTQLLAQGGNNDLQSLLPISPIVTRDNYMQTDAGRMAASNPKLTPPVQVGSFTNALMNTPLVHMPQEAFNTLIPIPQLGTQSMTDAIAGVQNAYYDVLLQQMSAQNDQQKAVADSNYQLLRSNVERQLGVTLSNNALDAWNQIQNVYNQYAQQGISGSGIQQETIDDYLRRVRGNNQIQRSYAQSQETSAQAQYYQNFASPDQVKALVASNPDQAKAWGLVPSDATKTALSFSTLKAQYPTLSDQQINDYISSTLDQNGNLRSQLYQSYMTNQLQTLQNENSAKQSQVIKDSLAAEEQKARTFTNDPNLQFVRTVKDASITPVLPNMATAPTLPQSSAPKSTAMTTQTTTPTLQSYPNVQSTVNSSQNTQPITPTTPFSIASYVNPNANFYNLPRSNTSRNTRNMGAPVNTPPTTLSLPQMVTNLSMPHSQTYNSQSNMTTFTPGQFYNTPLNPTNNNNSSNMLSSPFQHSQANPLAQGVLTPMKSSTTPTFYGAQISKSTIGTATPTISPFSNGLTAIKNLGTGIGGATKSIFSSIF